MNSEGSPKKMKNFKLKGQQQDEEVEKELKEIRPTIPHSDSHSEKDNKEEENEQEENNFQQFHHYRGNRGTYRGRGGRYNGYRKDYGKWNHQHPRTYYKQQQQQPHDKERDYQKNRNFEALSLEENSNRSPSSPSLNQNNNRRGHYHHQNDRTYNNDGGNRGGWKDHRGGGRRNYYEDRQWNGHHHHHHQNYRQDENNNNRPTNTRPFYDNHNHHRSNDNQEFETYNGYGGHFYFAPPPFSNPIPFFLPSRPEDYSNCTFASLARQERIYQQNSQRAIEQGDWGWHETTYSGGKEDHLAQGDSGKRNTPPLEEHEDPTSEGGPLCMQKYKDEIPNGLGDFLFSCMKPEMAVANAAWFAKGTPIRLLNMGVDDFDSLSVTDSGVFSDNDGCSSGRSSPVSCKEGTVGGGERERFAILTYDQVKRVDCVLNEMVALEGRGNFPALELKLKDLLIAVKDRLHKEGIKIRDIRLNGGAASYALKDRLDFCCVCGIPYQPSGEDGGMLCSCLSTAEGQAKNFSYNDIDLIFGMELQTVKHFDRVKTAVLDALLDLLPPQVSRKRMSPCALKEAYVSKMVKVCEGDRWSLISLGNYPSANSNSSKGRSCSVELKFVDTMRRQYEFSVDSFQIVLDSLMLFYKCATVPMSSRFYPTVVGESVFGDFYGALYHLQNGLISTRHPEEIRGGGLLKYCNLLVRGNRPADIHAIPPLQRYMCSRFFIDFPEVEQQESKLRTYLQNHMSGVSARLRYAFLITLYHVVDSSTVCLMGHERRLTLTLIQRLACELFSTDNGSQGIYGPQPTYHNYSTTYYMQQSSNGNSLDPAPAPNGTTYYNNPPTHSTTPQVSASTSSPAVLSTTSQPSQQQNYQSHRSQKSCSNNKTRHSQQQTQPIQNSSSKSSITLPVPLLTASS